MDWHVFREQVPMFHINMLEYKAVFRAFEQSLINLELAQTINVTQSNNILYIQTWGRTVLVIHECSKVLRIGNMPSVLCINS